MARPKRRRRREQHEVRVGIEHLAVRVEPRETLGILDLDLWLERRIFGDHGGQALPAYREVVREEIAQCHALDVVARREAVLRRASAAVAATDQAESDGLRDAA